MEQSTTEFSKLRKQKLLHLFRLIDVNETDYIDRKDLKNVVDRIVFARKINNANIDRIAIDEKLMQLWQTLTGMSDINFDGRVTAEEWLKFFEHAMSEKIFVDGIIHPIEQVLVDLMDTNGDGYITYNDYREMVLAWNVNETELTQLFQRVDLNRNGRISRDEANKAIREFFMSDDDMPGNWFFGDFTSA